ncbi:MAG: hypothetical protein FJZ56_06275 [Chlamydiae bacterium]|nr:hypothetical protein [Chlamydiota bacterium]
MHITHIQAAKQLEQHNAAKVIQTAWRQKLEKDFSLEWSVCKQFRDCISASSSEMLASKFQDISSSSEKIYTRQDANFIVRDLGAKKALTRYKKMYQAYRLIKQLGLSSLFVPNARVCGNFLLEAKIEFSASLRSQYETYFNHQELFTKAIRELLQFLSRSEIKNMTTEMYGEANYPEFFEVEPNYTVTNLSIRAHSAAITFFDLEHWALASKKGMMSILQSCIDLTTVFPKHNQMITEFGVRQGMHQEALEAVLGQKKSLLLNGWDRLFQGHSAHLTPKKILREREIGFTFSLQGIEKGLVEIEVELQKIHLGEYGKFAQGCLGENVLRTLAVLEPSLRDWIKTIEEGLSKMLSEKNILNPSQISAAAILESRTCTIVFEELTEIGPMWDYLDAAPIEDEPKEQLLKFQFLLLKALFKGISSQKDIYYFSNPARNTLRIYF